MIESGETGLAKVGGILVELRAEAGGSAQVVIGIGLNLALDEQDRAAIAALGNAASSLVDCGVDVHPRNRLVADIVSDCVIGLERFRLEGFSPFKESWPSADALRDQPVTVQDVNGARRGTARGIDAQGALQLEREDGPRELVVAGDVSVRR